MAKNDGGAGLSRIGGTGKLDEVFGEVGAVNFDEGVKNVDLGNIDGVVGDLGGRRGSEVGAGKPILGVGIVRFFAGNSLDGGVGGGGRVGSGGGKEGGLGFVDWGDEGLPGEVGGEEKIILNDGPGNVGHEKATDGDQDGGHKAGELAGQPREAAGGNG